MMRDRLPNISIRIDTPQTEFLRRMETVALQSGEYLIEPRQAGEPQGEIGSLQVAPLMVTQNHNLIGSLSADATDTGRVMVEVTAERWDPEPPTYKIYVAAAQDIFAPLLHLYNHAHGTSRRLNIPTPTETEPQLPEKTEVVFNNFAAEADQHGLRRDDWGRLFDLIWHCTTYNVELAEPDLVRLLRLKGFDEQHARDVARIFAAGRRMLLRKWRGSGEASGEGDIEN